jgi:hypothetical protein
MGRYSDLILSELIRHGDDETSRYEGGGRQAKG